MLARMLSGIGEAAQRSHPPSRSVLALPLSIGAHVIVLYAVSQAAWDEIDEARRAPLRVAWVTMPRTVPREPPAADSEPVAAESVESAEEAAADVAPADSPPAPPLEQSTNPNEQPAEESVATPAEPSTPIEPLPRPRVDWQLARQAAAAATIEARDRESRFSTFSAGDHIVVEERPKLSPLAEAMTSPQPGRSFARPGQQRTKIGRRLANACNAFTGGFGVSLFGFNFGGISFCSDKEAEGGLFADIEPDYLQLPECFDAGVDPEAGIPAGPLRDPATAKCRIGPAAPSAR